VAQPAPRDRRRRRPLKRITDTNNGEIDAVIRFLDAAVGKMLKPQPNIQIKDNSYILLERRMLKVIPKVAERPAGRAQMTDQRIL
jgi:hypothetical protein